MLGTQSAHYALSLNYRMTELHSGRNRSDIYHFYYNWEISLEQQRQVQFDNNSREIQVK